MLVTFGQVSVGVDSDAEGAEVTIVGSPGYAEEDWTRACAHVAGLGLGTPAASWDAEDQWTGWYPQPLQPNG